MENDEFFEQLLEYHNQSLCSMLGVPLEYLEHRDSKEYEDMKLRYPEMFKGEE